MYFSLNRASCKHACAELWGQLIVYGAVIPALLLSFSAKALAFANDAAEVEVPVGENERLLVIAPHPDDESLGAGGLVQRVLARGGSVRVVVMTAGDGFVGAVKQATGREQPRASDFVRYGQRRILEVNAAARALGPRGIRVDVLGLPDGGLLPLLSTHFARVHPGRSPTTQRTRAPYRSTLGRSVTYAGADVRASLLQVVRKFEPTMIAFTDPLDEHPDHRATGIFALLTASDWMRARPQAERWPRMLAFLVHWQQWPPDSSEENPPSYVADRALRLPIDLPLRNQERACLTLSDDELQHKRRALSQHKTQQQVMPAFLGAFVRRTECFSLNTQHSAADIQAEVERMVPQPGHAAPSFAHRHAH